MGFDFSNSGNARVTGHTLGSLFMSGVLDVSRFQVAVSRGLADIKNAIPVGSDREDAIDAFVHGIGSGIGYNLPEGLEDF